MVISEKYKFVFIRVPKNASSSLAEFFVRNCCDENDIYTEVNDCGIPSQNVDSKLIRKYAHQYRFIHLTLQELHDNGLVTEEEMTRKQVISVLRNPLMRQLSLYFFLKRGRAKSVDEFRELFKDGYHATDTNNKILQTDYAKINGVDYGTWWLYNKLDRHVSAFCAEHGLPVSSKLKNFKGNYTPKHYELIDEYYDTKTMDAVRKYYEKDFERLIELETGLEL